MSLRARYSGVSLGIFAGDLCNLRNEARVAGTWGCDLLHFDVMDGVFVPQMTGGPGLLKIQDATMFKDVHLMVQRPARLIDAFVAAGADAITVHVESEGCLEAMSAIRASSEKHGREVLTGVSLMPGTTLDAARAGLDAGPDVVLVLAVDPRGSDPADVPAACARLAELRKVQPEAIMAFDGGVTLDTLPQIVAAGADVVVSGSAIMRAPDPKHSFEAMRAMMRAGQT
ncbi:MAG: ribulose-phosphate 3-epimerase [Albidovulum sp.]